MGAQSIHDTSTTQTGRSESIIIGSGLHKINITGAGVRACLTRPPSCEYERKRLANFFIADSVGLNCTFTGLRGSKARERMWSECHFELYWLINRLLGFGVYDFLPPLSQSFPSEFVSVHAAGNLRSYWAAPITFQALQFGFNLFKHRWTSSFTSNNSSRLSPFAMREKSGNIWANKGLCVVITYGPGNWGHQEIERRRQERKAPEESKKLGHLWKIIVILSLNLHAECDCFS